MNKLVIPHDKALHAIWGALIFAAAGIAAYLLGAHQTARVWGAAAAVLAGVLKEAWDYVLNRRARSRGQAEPHEVEGSDLAWTAGGALVVWLAAALTEPMT